MTGIHVLDRVIGNEYPEFATEADVRAFEQVPYKDRIAAESTYDAIKLAAARTPRTHLPFNSFPTRIRRISRS